MKKYVLLTGLFVLCTSFGCTPESKPNPTIPERPPVAPEGKTLPKGVVGFPPEPL